jgi:hypothetical protein
MTTPLIGRNVRVEVSKTEAAAKTVTAVSLANPGVATSTAHALADGSVGYFNAVTGMVNLEGQPARVDAPVANTFNLEGINTTGYPAFTAGTFVPVTVWSTLSRAAAYDIGGGAADPIDTTVLLDIIKQQANGLLAAQSVKIDLKLDTTDEEALTLVRAAALSQAYLVFRITLSDGSQRIFRGQPSLPGESVGQGALGTGSFDVNVKGSVLFLGPVA